MLDGGRLRERDVSDGMYSELLLLVAEVMVVLLDFVGIMFCSLPVVCCVVSGNVMSR